MATPLDPIAQLESMPRIAIQSAGDHSDKQPDTELMRRLYAYMLKCRMVEERIRLLYRQGRFAGNYFAAVGQEATEVNNAVVLKDFLDRKLTPKAASRRAA